MGCAGLSEPVSLMRGDATSCRLVRKVPSVKGLERPSPLILLDLVPRPSVQSDAASYGFGARRTAPFSAPLGTTVGTFLAPGWPVPVARISAASDGFRESSDGLLENGEVAHKVQQVRRAQHPRHKDLLAVQPDTFAGPSTVLAVVRK